MSSFQAVNKFEGAQGRQCWVGEGVRPKASVQWCLCLTRWPGRLQKHEMSLNELVSCIWRPVNAGNRRKVG